MSEIEVDSSPSDEKLAKLGVMGWPIWTKEISEFPWSYSSQETCYFLEGEVEVTQEDGTSVSMGKGDLVVFPKGMKCTWKILGDVRKHYTFD